MELYSALDTITNQNTIPLHGSKLVPYICISCRTPVIWCDGKYIVQYFRHVRRDLDNVCLFLQEPPPCNKTYEYGCRMKCAKEISEQDRIDINVLCVGHQTISYIGKNTEQIDKLHHPRSQYCMTFDLPHYDQITPHHIPYENRTTRWPIRWDFLKYFPHDYLYGEVKINLCNHKNPTIKGIYIKEQCYLIVRDNRYYDTEVCKRILQFKSILSISRHRLIDYRIRLLNIHPVQISAEFKNTLFMTLLYKNVTHSTNFIDMQRHYTILKANSNPRFSTILNMVVFNPHEMKDFGKYSIRYKICFPNGIA